VSRRVVVTGGAGFLGSHLCERLWARGDAVACVDNLSSGSLANLSALIGDVRFEFFERDVSQALSVDGRIDAVVHLASPASPVDYLAHPLETMAVSSEGTRRCLALATEHGARFILASTSEVYGEPLEHPQREEYWGNVNPIGPRSVYDEAKRFAEALTMAWHRVQQTNIGIVRIFNTYGPRLRPGDGRVVSTFIAQALTGRPLTIFGDGSQTRSLCYVEDEVSGLLALLDSDVVGPVNLGNPEEHTVSEIASLVLAATGSSVPIEFRKLPTDDPSRRRPSIEKATQLLGWRPVVPLEQGLKSTVAWMRENGGLNRDG
jgi:dTDP-glucose 4,6-dehydratase